jgi:hypothetical protein
MKLLLNSNNEAGIAPPPFANGQVLQEELRESALDGRTWPCEHYF